MNFIRFLKQFMLCPSQTGAIAKSSEGLADLITNTAELPKASVVIEFGSGTGVFTEKILQKTRSGTTFFAIEINADFIEATQTRCPNVQIYQDCATNAGKYLKIHSHRYCDCIISGLPWASFTDDLQDDLIDTILDVLKPGGKFLTFAYLQGLLLPNGRRFKKKLQAKFKNITTTQTMWMNIPPAFVYCAEK